MTKHKFTYRHDEACYLGERYPQHEVVIQSDCDDLTADEILQLFKSYMVACGYAEQSFYDACETAADENNPYRRKVEQTKEVFHSWRDNIKVHPEKTDQIHTNRIKEILD